MPKEISAELINGIGNAIVDALPPRHAFLLIVVGPENPNGDAPDFAHVANLEIDYARKIARGYLMHTAAEAEEN